MFFCFALTWGVHARAVLQAPMLEDDFLAGRPWTAAEVRATWHGSWNQGGDADHHYRPMTALYYAAAFDLFGWNTTARHGVSLAELALAAWLLALFVARERGAAAGSVIAALYISHPLVPSAAVAWTFNQMHQVITLLVLAAMLVWQRVRTGGWTGWLPVLGLITIGVLFKEDTIVVIPVLLAWHQLRAWWVGDIDPVPPKVWALAAATVAGLVLLRVAAYPDSEWMRVPMLASGRTGLALECLKHGLGWMGPAWDLKVPVAASTIAVGIVAMGLMSAARRHRTIDAWLTVSALTFVLAAAAPLTLVANTHHTRSHLIALGSAMLIGAALLSALRWWRRPAFAAPLIVAALAMLILFSRGAVAMDRYFWACQPNMIESAGFAATDYPWLDPDVRRWLLTQAQQCAAGTLQSEIRALPVVVWHPPVDWPAAPHATVALLSQRTGTAVVTLRAPAARPDAPVGVRLSTDTVTQQLDLTSAEWQTARVPLVPNWRFWLRQSHLLWIVGPRAADRIEVAGIRLLPAAE